MTTPGQGHAPFATSLPGLTAPTPEQRQEARQRPAGLGAGRQRWNHLFFAHWPVEPSLVQATLPPGLQVDTFDGRAYVGIVPFAMERVRPTGLPALPWISWFLELNVRTYVHDAAGRPGVWFYSLDCNQPVAVEIARRWFHLPYQHARMAADFADPYIEYGCERRQADSLQAHYTWRPGRDGREAEPGSLEFFLVERYRLFVADRRGRLQAGRVHHAPYRIHEPTVTECSTEPARLAGFDLNGPPTSVLTADAVDVTIFPLQPCA